VEFRLLGDVEVLVGDRVVEVGHLRQRTVLVALLVEANRAVSADRLLDRVWGDRPPQRARGALYSYLSRLRQVLGRDQGVGIVRRPAGYVITVDPMAVDVHRFRGLVEQARAAGDATVAASLFRQALELWRGDAFPTMDTPWLNAIREGLNAQRLAAELDRNDLALQCGRHAEILSELCVRADEHPLDERLAGQLLLALYRCGRQAEALDRYARTRLVLAEELGADPSPPLRRLYQQILTADTCLAAPTAGPMANVTTTPVPRQLPRPPCSFTGRTSELAELDRAMTAQPGSTAVIAVICGTAGIGKTWLAARWAHDNAHRFPDGQLYVNLRGYDPSGDAHAPTTVVRAFLDALGVAPAAIPVDPEAQQGLFRSLVADKRLLIVLDNARDTAQVTPLLPGACAVLVTSRHQLSGLVATHGAQPLALDILSESDARDLLTGHLGAHRLPAEPVAVTALLQQCAGLPLALGIVAARAALQPGLPLAALTAELRDARLDALDAGELTANLRAVFACSYRALTPGAARMFGLLGVAPGPDIGLAAAASLAGVAVPGARALLRELVNANLVREHTPGRLRMHDLVRLYATEMAPSDAASHRILDHYVHTGRAAALVLAPQRDIIAAAACQPGVRPEEFADHERALAWFAVEHQVLLAAIELAGQTGFDTHAWQLASTLTPFFDRRGHWHDRATTQQAALDAARRLGDRTAQAHAHRGLALAYTWLTRYAEADTQLRQAFTLFVELDDVKGQAHAHRSLARLSAQQGRPADALPHDEKALELYAAIGCRAGQATALNAVGWHHAHLGNLDLAVRYCEQALAMYGDLDDRNAEAATWDSVGYARHHLGHHDLAVSCYHRALALRREVGNRYGEASALHHLGDTLAAMGRCSAARETWQLSYEILDQLGHPDAALVRAKLQ
jgi:DNA-binding SARP family transcriptional activator